MCKTHISFKHNFFFFFKERERTFIANCYYQGEDYILANCTGAFTELLIKIICDSWRLSLTDDSPAIPTVGD